MAGQVNEVFDMTITMMGLSHFELHANLRDYMESDPNYWDQDDLLIFNLLQYEKARRN